MQQKLIQIHNEIMELAQDQESCNSVLGMMLSSAECLSSRFGKNKFERLFNGYNVFESGDSKDEESLKTQLRIQTKLFRNNFYYMKQKRGEYSFPNNFTRDKIIEIINIWKKNVNDDKKIFYNNIIDIITDKTIQVKYPSQKIDYFTNNGISQNVILNVMAPIMSHVDQGLEKAKKEAELKGTINNVLDINKKNYDSKSLEIQIKNFNDKELKHNDKRSELRNMIISTMLKSLNFGECFYILNSNDNSYRAKYNKKEDYINQDYFKIQNIFRNHLNDLEKMMNEFKATYGDSDSISNIINENYHIVALWQNKSKDSLFDKFYQLMKSNEH
jgi:hypothetical protein